LTHSFAREELELLESSMAILPELGPKHVKPVDDEIRNPHAG
jgi:hypothetical protein